MLPDAMRRAELAGYRRDFIAVLQVRAPMTLLFQTQLIPLHALWEALGFLLVGMGLFRPGLLSTAALARTAAVLIPVGTVFGAQLAG